MEKYFEFLMRAPRGNRAARVLRLQRYFNLKEIDAFLIVLEWEKHPEYHRAYDR